MGIIPNEINKSKKAKKLCSVHIPTEIKSCFSISLLVVCNLCRIYMNIGFSGEDYHMGGLHFSYLIGPNH